MLGGLISSADATTPTITVGHATRPQRDGFHIRTVCAGWRGGICPAHAASKLGTKLPVSVASCLAAALAVNEAYLFMSDGSPIAGKRLVGMSLWNLTPEATWLDPTDEPELKYLPSKLWLIGLGHLGQAYLWNMGLLPYPDPSKCNFVLQDVDIATPSTESTSVLTEKPLVGKMKTRSMAAWCDQRGFNASIYERRFDDSFRRQASEPTIALCGIDNALGRTALDQVGFDLMVEVGLGRGHRDFRTIRLHTLPGSRTASEIWQAGPANATAVSENEGYQRLLREGTLDQCGVTLLAGKAVGAPFVGMAAAAMAIAEVLRQLHGGSLYQLTDLDLVTIEHRTVVPNPHDFSKLNPGFHSLT